MAHQTATLTTPRASRKPAPAWSPTDRSGESGKRPPIQGKCILVVEDEFLLADQIAEWLKSRGAHPVGPAATLATAQRLMESENQIDCAVLDINLAGAPVFPLALELERQRIPLIFASAYAHDVNFPTELEDKVRLSKPFGEAQLIEAVNRVLDSSDRPPSK